MKHLNNYSLPREPKGAWLRRLVRHLRKWSARNGRTVQEQMIRGASYSAGSGAVSLLIVWWQNRH